MEVEYENKTPEQIKQIVKKMKRLWVLVAQNRNNILSSRRNYYKDWNSKG